MGLPQRRLVYLAIAVSAACRLGYAGRVLNLPPRPQWHGNYGYCGETAFVAAGLYYGQYLSQYDARAAATPGVAQNAIDSQLLLGVNDQKAASRMSLTSEVWQPAAGRTTDQFLSWVTRHLALGHPVIIGVYMNQRLFDDDDSPAAGDPDYDHIVPVFGFQGGGTVPERLQFSDNGLWPVGGPPRFVFAPRFPAFIRDRRQANASPAPYSLDGGGNDYGIAITGIADRHRQTLPVRVDTDPRSEPPIADGAADRPAPIPLRLRITVSALAPGTPYRLYRYHRLEDVPDREFNANAARAFQRWDFDGTSEPFTLPLDIESDEIAVFRAVPATAP
jgi:hypothetical protein